jgi:hypothetical protein
MIVCLVKAPGGVLNTIKMPIYLSPIAKREAYLLRDRWRISTEPHATVEISFV